MAARASRRRSKRPSDRKDRLVQTRVPRDLEVALKAEARRRRSSVSQLIRSVLEDALDLVDGVASDVDRIVSDSVHLARHARDNARRLVAARPEGGLLPARPEGGLLQDLAHVAAWNDAVLNRAVDCSVCARELARGERAHLGLSDDPRAQATWLCPDCLAALAARG